VVKKGFWDRVGRFRDSTKTESGLQTKKKREVTDVEIHDEGEKKLRRGRGRDAELRNRGGCVQKSTWVGKRS